MTLGREERHSLLRIARASIEALLDGREYEGPDGPVMLVQGAFVTLRRRADHELRGCIGTLRPPSGGLGRMIAETACAAAARDGRFSPVALAELPGLKIEISLLGPLAPCSAEAVEVGRHGLLLRLHGRHGLLLPQVPVEHGWDRETFLDWTCRKAGLPPGSWRDRACELQAFTAEVFAED